MRPSHFLTALIPLFGIALTSCDDGGDNAILRPKAVIEGWIDSGGYPKVIFTSAFIAGEESATISDKLIRWGKVTITDGTDTVIMTGGPDKDVFPPYSYYTYDMTGRPGMTYTITATYDDIDVTASCTMPEAPDVIRIDTSPSATSDTLRNATVFIRPPADGAPAWYHISTRVLPEDGRFLPAVLGCAEAAPGQTEPVEIPVYRSKGSLSSADFVPQIPSNRRVLVRVERVTREIYLFYQAYNEATLFGSSQFVSHSEALPGNINDGFGYWSAQGTVTVTLEATGNAPRKKTVGI